LPSKMRMSEKRWEVKIILRIFVLLAKEFDEIKFTHIGKDKNQFADALAILTSIAGRHRPESVYWKWGLSIIMIIRFKSRYLIS
jgi:hypothetical protein